MLLSKDVFDDRYGEVASMIDGRRGIGRVRCSRVRDKGLFQMKGVFDWRLDRVVYDDLYRWIIIDLIKIKREAVHR